MFSHHIHYSTTIPNHLDSFHPSSPTTLYHILSTIATSSTTANHRIISNHLSISHRTSILYHTSVTTIIYHRPPSFITNHRHTQVCPSYTQRGNDMPPCQFHVSLHISATYCVEFRTQRFGSIMQKQYATTKISCTVSQLFIVAHRSQNEWGRGRLMEEKGEVLGLNEYLWY